MSLQLARRTFTVDEYHQMAEMGFFAEDYRSELIHGEIVEMSHIGRIHAAAVDRLVDLFSTANSRPYIIRAQNPIKLSDFSEPQPDVALLKRRDDFYASAHPQPADVLLLIEVADSSLAYDREIKVPLYAKAGIPEVWIVNLNELEIELYRYPANGKYTEVRYPQPGDSVAPVLLPQLVYEVDQLTGRA